MLFEAIQVRLSASFGIPLGTQKAHFENAKFKFCVC
jgi:hypothetical protein